MGCGRSRPSRTEFGSALVPLTADGMIIACTALRLAALTRGWRLPGSLVITYAFIAGTVVAERRQPRTAGPTRSRTRSRRSPTRCWSRCSRTCCGCTSAWPSRPSRAPGRRPGPAGLLTWVTSPVVTTRVVAAPGPDRRRRPGRRPGAGPAAHPHVVPAARGLPQPGRSRLVAVRLGPRRPDGGAADRPRRPALRRDLAGLLPQATAADRLHARWRCSPWSTPPHCSAPHPLSPAAPPTAPPTAPSTAPQCTRPVHHVHRTSAAPADRTSAPQSGRTGAPRTDAELVAACTGTRPSTTTASPVPARGDAPPRRRHPQGQAARPARRVGRAHRPPDPPPAMRRTRRPRPTRTSSHEPGRTRPAHDDRRTTETDEPPRRGTTR